MSPTIVRIPVFVSSPSRLVARQQASVDVIKTLLLENGLEWKALGVTDYLVQSPLKSVLSLIAKSHGGIVLGFERIRVTPQVTGGGSPAKTISVPQSVASSWQHIEAAIMLARELPVLIFKEKCVNDGVFDPGATDARIYNMPTPGVSNDNVRTALARWATEVRQHYDEANARYDVFVSFSGEDEIQAREVTDYLSREGLRVFFSKTSIPQQAQADYMKSINRAVDGSHHMVVVSRTAAGFAKLWVEREWEMFLNEKLSGRKTGNLVVINAGNVDVAALPLALRSNQVVPLSSAGLSEALQFLSKS